MKKAYSILLSAVICVALCMSAFAADPNAKVTKIKISRNTINMAAGDTQTLNIQFTPKGATDSLTWSSRDAAIATVDSTGKVTATGKGVTTIKVETAGGLTANCQVIVRNAGEAIEVKNVEISATSMTLRIDQARILLADVTPANATYKEVIWFSSDTNIATVDEDGIVTGVAPGTAIITAATDNDRYATCKVTVSGNVAKSAVEDAKNTETGNGGETLTSADVKTAVESVAQATAKGATGTATFKDKSSISPAVLSAATDTAKTNNRSVLLKFTTTGKDGALQGSLTLDPGKCKELTGDIKPGIFTDSAKAASVSAIFAKYFRNTVAVIHCAQSGNYGLNVQLSVKLDLSGMNRDTLRFYTYDSTSNSYKSLAVASYTINENGYLRFSTSTGGIIVVTDRALAN